MWGEITDILWAKDSKLTDKETKELEKRAKEIKKWDSKLKQEIQTELEEKFKVKDLMQECLSSPDLKKSENVSLVQLYLIINWVANIKIDWNMSNDLASKITEFLWQKSSNFEVKDSKELKSYAKNKLELLFPKQKDLISSSFESFSFKDIPDDFVTKLDGYDDDYYKLTYVFKFLEWDSSTKKTLYMKLVQSKLSTKDADNDSNPLRTHILEHFDSWINSLDFNDGGFKYLWEIWKAVQSKDKEKILTSIWEISSYDFSCLNAQFPIRDILWGILMKNWFDAKDKWEIINYYDLVIGAKLKNENNNRLRLEDIKSKLKFENIMSEFLNNVDSKKDPKLHQSVSLVKESMNDGKTKDFMQDCFIQALKRTDQAIVENPNNRYKYAEIVIYNYNYILWEKCAKSWNLLPENQKTALLVILDYYSKNSKELLWMMKQLNISNHEERISKEKISLFKKIYHNFDTKDIHDADDINNTDIFDMIVDHRLKNKWWKMNFDEIQSEYVLSNVKKQLIFDIEWSKDEWSKTHMKSALKQVDKISQQSWLSSLQKIEKIKQLFSTNPNILKLIDEKYKWAFEQKESIKTIYDHLDKNDNIKDQVQSSQENCQKIEEQSKQMSDFYDSKEFVDSLNKVDYKKEINSSVENLNVSTNILSSNSLVVNNKDSLSSIEQWVSIPSTFWFKNNNSLYEAKNPFYNPDVPQSSPIISAYMWMELQREMVEQYFCGLWIPTSLVKFSPDDVVKKIWFKFPEDLNANNVNEYTSKLLMQVEKVVWKIVFESIKNDLKSIPDNVSTISLKKWLKDCWRDLIEEFSMNKQSKKSLIEFFHMIKWQEKLFPWISLLNPDNSVVDFWLISDWFSDDLWYINNYFIKEKEKIAYWNKI